MHRDDLATVAVAAVAAVAGKRPGATATAIRAPYSFARKSIDFPLFNDGVCRLFQLRLGPDLSTPIAVAPRPGPWDTHRRSGRAPIPPVGGGQSAESTCRATHGPIRLWPAM